MAKFRLGVLNTQPPHLYCGGVERRILETTKRLQSNADISVYSGTKGGFKTPTSVDGVSFVPCRSTNVVYPLDNWTFNRSLLKKVRSLQVDVFEGHAVSGYGLPKKLKQLGIRSPFIHLVHGVLADEYEKAKFIEHQTLRERVANRFMRYLAGLEGQTARDANIVVTISRYSFAKISENYNIDMSKVRIVPNGVDVVKFRPVDDILAVRRRFGVGNEPCVVFVGSLIPRKGLEFLLQAAKEIVRERSDVKFLIVGEGPLRGEFERSLANVGLLANFRFLGRVEEDLLALVYGCGDVFVLPSIQEGQGIVLLEAQACGRPVVAFDVGGVPEVVRNGVSGLLVEQGNSMGFADAVLKLLDDDSLRLRMGKFGRRFVLENFTWDLCAQRMLKVYEAAMEN